jgi:hypothetical protein
VRTIRTSKSNKITASDKELESLADGLTEDVFQCVCELTASSHCP